MISWELPEENAECPHCGSTDTVMKLQLLGLVRFTCSSCRKSFAIQAGKSPSGSAKRADPDSHQA